MKVWINNKFAGHWGVPTAAVIIAETKERAEIILRYHLKSINLPQSSNESRLFVQEISLDEEGVTILSDGDCQ